MQNARLTAEQDSKAGRAVDVKLFDQVLVDRRGNSVKFKSDAIGDGVVVIDFIYTTCTTICPVLSQIMAIVQDRLAHLKNGVKVRLISISVDPATDTPARLNKFAKRFGVRPGWTWLTGKRRNVYRVLDGLGAYTPDFEDHATMILVGDVRRGRWTRFLGFPDPDRIVEKVTEFNDTRNSSR
jgi:cytochrome oxidase Cu insertion factor (SCO1/SenC/PrrC family)